MKELQVTRHVRELSLDDDDEPPLLEVEAEGNAHLTVDNQREEDEHEGPSLMDEMVATAQRAKQEKRALQEKERSSKSFGQGLKKGFFNVPKLAAKGASLQVKQQQKKGKSDEQKKIPTREELLIVKPSAQQQPSQTAASPLVFPEVQSALESMHQLDPKAWMNAKFFEKLAKNPRLALALQNPRFTQAIDEMQRDPEAAMRKYRKDEAVSAMLQEFMGFLGSHFEELGKEQEAVVEQQQTETKHNNQQDEDRSALLIQPSASTRKTSTTTSTTTKPAIVDLDEARREAIAGMERSPEEDAQVQQILRDPELLQALSDAELMQRLHRCKDAPEELRRIQQDPKLARKLQLLVDARLVQFA